MTFRKSAHLLTGYGVCASYADLFQCFMKEAGINSIYVVNSGIKIGDNVGNHAWNLVETDKDKHIWHYMDVTWHWFLYGQNSITDGCHVGYRSQDLLNNPEYINNIFSNNSYDSNVNTISDTDYEPISTEYLCLNSAVDENYTVSLAHSEDLTHIESDNGVINNVKLFGENSLFNEGVSVCVNNIPIYKFNSISDFESANNITGNYVFSNGYTVSYEIERKNNKTYIHLFDNNAVFIDFKDTTSLVSKYVIEVGNAVREYNESAYVKLNDSFLIKFYDADGYILTNANSKSFSERKGFFNNRSAAYKLNSEVIAQRDVIKFTAHHLGDIDMDGKLTNTDASILQKYLIKGYQFIQTGSDGDLTIDIDNVTINGDISSNGTFTLNANNANINGTLSAQNFVNNITGNFNSNHPISNETFDMDYISSVLSDSNMISYYFSNAPSYNQNTVNEMIDYAFDRNTATFANPFICNGNMTIDVTGGNVNFDTNIKTTGDMNLNMNTFNMHDTVLYSQYGDISIDATNFNFNGVIYAPNGKVTVNALNQNITGTIIAKEIEITGDSNVNFTVAAQGVLKNITDNLTLTNYQLLLADITKDYKINVIDLISLERAILNSAA